MGRCASTSSLTQGPSRGRPWPEDLSSPCAICNAEEGEACDTVYGAHDRLTAEQAEAAYAPPPSSRRPRAEQARKTSSPRQAEKKERAA